MKKLLLLLALVLLTMGVASATFTDYCTDTDSGKDIWTPGSATDWDWHSHFGGHWNQDSYVDDCDGSGENLKEGYCDSNNGKFANIKCSDYGAICVSVRHGPDYCACPENKWFDGDSCETPVCGDGAINQASEECDDDNTDNNDGCSSTCQDEVCGDGIQQTNEACDVGTGNFEETCTPDYGESCMVCTSSCTIYSAVGGRCGDQTINGPEVCEVGDTKACTTADNYAGEETCLDSCDGWDGLCVPTESCGDQVVNGDEVCEIGETEKCRTEAGYSGEKTCTGSCVWGTCDSDEFCGDGIINDDEECDGLDGEFAAHEFCNSDCEIEVGPYCGDGFVDKGEECDDGNNENKDGCSAVCEKEDIPVPEFSEVGAVLVSVLSGLALVALRKK